MNAQSAIIFDLDGTLTEPWLDFDAIRTELDIEGPILEAVQAMKGARRTHVEAVLQRHEHAAAEGSVLRAGAARVIEACRQHGIRPAILTRNSREHLETVLTKHNLTVDAIRTRDDGAIKPSPEPVLSICLELNAAPNESWMVGDYLFDIQSGRAAGATTVLVVGDGPTPDYASLADHTIRQLTELLPMLNLA